MQKVGKTKNGRITLLLKCAIGNSKKPRFIKAQEASALFSSLKIKTNLSKISLFRPAFILGVLGS